MHLWARMELPGWSRHWQNFTGTDYQALDRIAITGYLQPPYCKAEDEAKVAEYPFHNLYAVRESGHADARLLLMGAHWDSLLRSSRDPDPAKRDLPYPSANDGASGVGLLLTLMRDLEGIDLPFDVGVIFFDGEDGFEACYPIAGSLYFTQNLPRSVHRLLLLDMVGSPDARFLRESHSLESDPGFVDLLWKHGHAYGGAVHFTPRTNSIADDHVAFIDAGIPAVDLIDAARDTIFPPEWHTTMDTVDRLSPDMLALVGDTVLATLQDPEFVATWPGVGGHG